MEKSNSLSNLSDNIVNANTKLYWVYAALLRLQARSCYRITCLHLHVNLIRRCHTFDPCIVLCTRIDESVIAVMHLSTLEWLHYNGNKMCNFEICRLRDQKQQIKFDSQQKRHYGDLVIRDRMDFKSYSIIFNGCIQRALRSNIVF